MKRGGTRNPWGQDFFEKEEREGEEDQGRCDDYEVRKKKGIKFGKRNPSCGGLKVFEFWEEATREGEALKPGAKEGGGPIGAEKVRNVPQGIRSAPRAAEEGRVVDPIVTRSAKEKGVIFVATRTTKVKIARSQSGWETKALIEELSWC